jgi:YVTN family beta-propeller protein
MRRVRWLGFVVLCLALALAGCSLPLTPLTQPDPTATPEPAVIPLPPQLADYHIFVTDLSNGTLAELGKRTYHVSKSIHGLALSNDGHTLYVSDVSGNQLIAYGLMPGGQLVPIYHSAPVGVQPVHMVETLDASDVYVTNFGAANVSVVDTATWTTTTTIDVPARPHGIILSPDGRFAYVSCYGGAAIAVIETTSATRVATIQLPVGAQPYGIALSQDGAYLYVSDNFTGRLFVIDTARRAVLTSVQVGEHPALIARSPDGTTLYVANGGSRSVSVLDLIKTPAHPKVRATVQVDGYPHGIAVSPDGRYVVVADTIGQDLAVIDATSDTLLTTIPAGQYPNDVLITP